ncbi:MAG: type II secretion system major pseudopilin GspG [Deltaproteobacteria bacterium]|nr:type II secretion system major pseudopilin GspG [Deltaproteobacteria bacterium]
MHTVRLRKTVPTRVAKQSAGFTLLEIMVVVIIIGTIAGLVGVKVLDRLEQANENAAEAQMSSIKNALDLFKMDNGSYPPDLQLLVTPPEAGGFGSNRGYLKGDEVPLDPWNMPYGYVSDGYQFTIWSNGPDKRPQTEDDIQG